MGFFLKIFPKKERTKDHVNQQQTQKKPPHWAALDEEDAFEDMYGQEIDRLQEQIDNATWTDSDNPADQIKAYEKALELCDKLENFCMMECGFYGYTYFLNHCADIKPRIETEYKVYMERDYPAQKSEWDKAQERKKAFSAMKRKILKYVSARNGVMRKEIYSQFDPEQQAEVLKALNALIQEGKIKKQTEGKRLLFVKAEA